MIEKFTEVLKMRRKTIGVNVGGVMIGSDYPVRVQSMTNTNTDDVDASVAQCRRIAYAGGEIVRLTAQGVKEAENIGRIRQQLRAEGCAVPLVADIHFNPKAAFAAAAVTDKVRINPGNFVDPARTFKTLSYTDAEYQAELARIREALLPFIALCREHGTAVRLGVNHGSLSDRIMSRYGNTAAGMVESVMEFLRVFVEQDFHNVVISMKASNVVVMIEAVRGVVAAMDAEDMHFPLHLGVTEAGFGEDGRIKSAVGIGCLLAEGLGDTIRVSLSEEPEQEIPVAQKLVDYTAHYQAPARVERLTLGGARAVPSKPVVIASCKPEDVKGNLKPDFYSSEMTAAEPATAAEALNILHLCYTDTSEEWLQVKAGVDFGTALLNDPTIDGIWLEAPNFAPDKVVATAFAILQAARLRTSKTEFISCPGCGRTMFDLQTTVQQVKAATSHLAHLKIGVMGCVVNGPGEMADADYGYVGAARGKISLYKGKECVEKNIPQAEAIPRLIALIKAHGDWKAP